MKRVDIGKCLRNAKTRDDLVLIAYCLGAPQAASKFPLDKDLYKYLKGVWERYESDPFRGTPSWTQRMKILCMGFERIEAMRKTLHNLELCLENARSFPVWVSELPDLAASLYGLGNAENALSLVEKESAQKKIRKRETKRKKR